MLRLAHIMTRDVVTVSSETTLRETAELFATHHISGAPVEQGGRIVGVISATDLLRFSASTPGRERDDQPAWADLVDQEDKDEPEWQDALSHSYLTDFWPDGAADVAERMTETPREDRDVLDEHTVDEVMTRELCSLSAADDVLTAADLMRRRAIHRVLVMDDERLVGIVSASDIARAVADRKLPVPHPRVRA